MNTYYYNNSEVIGYFMDKNKKMHIFTNREIVPADECHQSEDWIRKNITYYKKSDFRKLVSKRDWADIKKEYFSVASVVEFDTSKKGCFCADVPDSSEYKTDTGRDYYWPLGEIELEEVNL